MRIMHSTEIPIFFLKIHHAAICTEALDKSPLLYQQRNLLLPVIEGRII
jgi:hypothetical protein